MSCCRRLTFLLLLMHALLPVRAQPVRGVVWQPPAALERAAADLVWMHRAGVRAVRAPVIEDDRLLTLADSLGMQVFQELPLDQVPVSVLEDTLAAVTRLLDEVLSQALGHPSARHFGLVRSGDTAAPEACAMVAALAQRVRRHGPDGSRAYIVTPFVEAERCAAAVDFVLLDRFADPDPPETVQRWQAAHPGRSVGLAALGTWVDAGAALGLAVPLSAERQARYLETHLSALQAPVFEELVAVFVHRWRDAAEWPLPLPAAATHPDRLRSGLQAADGTPRPALAVVQGFFTGGQTVFAFDAGYPPPPSPPWLVLLGWLIVAAVGSAYASSIRFQRMVPRYFLAHGFYQEAVQQAREIPPVAGGVVFGALCLSAGVVGTVWLDDLSREPALALVAGWLPAPTRGLLLTLLRQPVVLAALLGSLYALSLAVWMSTLTMLARVRQRRLSATQMLTLVTWPRWTLLLLLAVALGVREVDSAWVTWGVPIGYLLVAALAVRRTLADYAALVPASPGMLAAAVLVHPLLLLALFAAALVVRYGGHALFVWHLIRFG